MGVIAQITPWKGQMHALWVLDRVRQTCPEAQLVLVGEAKFVTDVTRYDNRVYEQNLHRTVEEFGLQSGVRFLGEREEVERVIAALDVVLVPSVEEPFGRSVIEALAMNVPVVATDRGGPAEVVRPGIDGVVLPPDDVQAWAEAVVRMTQRNNDGGRRNDSRTYVRRRFSPDQHVATVLSVYARALSTRGIRGHQPAGSTPRRILQWALMLVPAGRSASLRARDSHSRTRNRLRMPWPRPGPSR